MVASIGDFFGGRDAASWHEKWGILAFGTPAAGAGRAGGEPLVVSGRTRPRSRGIPPVGTFAVHGDRRAGARRDRSDLAQHQALDLRRDPGDRDRHHDRAGMCSVSGCTNSVTKDAA
ncbi:hypothetical protein ACRAWF_30510 [Streptomyces sp. L7]